ncbi:hypothetical protein WN943_028086 [Citrus x changshan-huyou]
MDELGKLILTHYPYFSVTIIISTFPTSIAGDISNYISAVSAATTTPGTTFYHLPHLNIPTYLFYASSASALAQVLYLPNTYGTTNGLKDPQMVLDIPVLSPIRAKES